MKSVKPSSYVDYDQIIKDSDKYCDEFIKNGFILFKKINISEKQQIDFMSHYAKKLNWFNDADSNVFSKYRYEENHSRVMDFKKIPFDKYIISWHLEHVEIANDPIISATWNMFNFKCDNKNGQTHFVDTEKIYEQMSEEWKYFLLKSKEKIIKNGQTYIIDCVKPHWFTNKPVLRIDLQTEGLYDSLYKLNNIDPSTEDIKYFKEIRNFYFDQVLYNKDIRICHKWDEGDFLVVDLFKMAHTVTGGFSSKDRKFVGYWIFKSKGDYIKDVSKND